MSTKQPYKTYTRGQRIQDTNFVFSNGMRYTNAPLEEGFSKLLVNYDFDSDVGCLKPRKGLRTFGDLFTDPEGTFRLVDNDDDNDQLTIVNGIKIIRDNNVYYQIIIGKRVEPTGDTETRDIGDAWVLTCRKAFDNSNKLYIYYNILNADTNKCIFSRPDQAEHSIHNITLYNSPYVKKHIGTFAFNNEYYYFCTDNKLYHTYFDEGTKTFKVKVVTPFVPYQSETRNNLYNMLLENPFDFEIEERGSVLQLTGLMPTKTTSESQERTIINPKIGRRYNYKLFYTCPASESNSVYYFHISYTTNVNDTVYVVPRNEAVAYAVGASADPIVFNDIQIDSPSAMFIVYAVRASADDTLKFNENAQLTEEALQQAIIFHASFNYSESSEFDSTVDQTDEDLVSYTLSYAKGMTYWKNRLWLFGAKASNTGRSDNTILFASEVNRPDWFGYAADIDIFDEDIVHLQPMLDTLLVFTTQNLYSITMNEDGLGWSKQHLQSNLNISSWDYNLIQTVKNMVFFKSGNYYYMVVPKLTSASGSGLAIAPVSNNIINLLDNFEPAVKQIVDDLYNYSLETRAKFQAKTTFDLKLVHYYNFLDFEDVHNCYVFKCTKKEKVAFDSSESGFSTDGTTVYLNFELLYNTVNRTWRIYIFESERVIQPLFKNATGRATYANLIRDDEGKVSVQLLQYSDTLIEDQYIKQNEENATATAPLVLNNWQYLDTGNLDQSVDLKKRFREYQFKINNEIKGPLEFYSGFVVDKNVRTYEMRYILEYVEDSSEDSSTKYAVISAEPETGLQGNPTIVNASEISKTPDYTYTKLGSWKIGTSKFPEAKTWKIRVPTSGKGYLPRIILISYNSKNYELLSCSTVYRQLNSR